MSFHSVDVEILLEFLQQNECENLSESAISAKLASLETLSSMCSDNEVVDCLRELDGLKIVWDLCCKTKNASITQACLFCLACIAQSSVYAQQDLCLEHVFASLNRLLIYDEVPVKTKMLDTYFLLSLVSKNRQGQSLIASSGCLQSLMNKFVEYCDSISSNVQADKQDNCVDFWKVTSKTLSYAVNVPQNEENQEKVCKIMPWVVKGIHTSKKNPEVIRLLCALLSVMVEDNKVCQEIALSCRAVEALILLLNFLTRNTDSDESMGDAVAALNHVLPDDDGEHWEKFVSFGGTNLLMQLIGKLPTKHWMTYHVNQTLTLLSRCVKKRSEKFDVKYFHCVSQKIAKLMNAIPNDEYLNKISVHLLNFFLRTNDFQNILPSKVKRIANDTLTSSRQSTSSSCRRFDDLWKTTNESVENQKRSYYNDVLLKNNCNYQPVTTTKAYTTILINSRRTGNGDVILDISNSSRDALQASSGIDASPNDNVFLRPPLGSSRLILQEKRGVYKASAGEIFSGKSVSLTETASPMHSFMLPRRRVNDSIRFSTPKSKKTRKYPPPFHTTFTGRKTESQTDTTDLISLCGDLIDTEVRHSVKKHCGLMSMFGSSGQLPNKY